MTARQLFANNAVSLLMSPLSASDTALTVMAGHGALFPQPSQPGDFFLITLENEAATAREIIKVTGRTGDTFTGILRAQEGTTARAWTSGPGNDTLVDHRITADTIRRAMELPDLVSTQITVQQDGVDVGASATTLNFTGSGVAVSGSGATKTISISGGGGGSVPGSASNTATWVDPGFTQTASSVHYSKYNRGFKYFVTLYSPSNHNSCTFEVLGNISGDIDAGTEFAMWNRTARVGYNFAGTVEVTLNKATKEIELTWNNEEADAVEVMSTRIQHQS